MKFADIGRPISKPTKRLGRGIGSGKGKTAGRGTKGQNSRTGRKLRPGFEGGQNPLMQRLPKSRGFKSLNPNRQIVHSDELNRFDEGTVITPQLLHGAGLIQNPKAPVKIISRKALTKKFKISGVRVVSGLKSQLSVVKTPAAKKAATRDKA